MRTPSDTHAQPLPPRPLNECKGFLDLADKEGGEGIDASRLAKSISNIAYLKSER